MTSATLFGPGYQFFDALGLNPLASGSIVSYAAGTTTPQSMATNAAGTAASNPLNLDSGGRPNSGHGLWLIDGLSYDLRVYSGPNGTGSLVTTFSDVGGIASGTASATASFLTTSAESGLPGSSVLTSSGSVTVNTSSGVTTLFTSSVLSQKTADYIAVEDDNGATIVYTGAGPYSQFFDLAANLGNGWNINVVNQSTSDLTVDPAGSQLINGAATFIIPAGSGGRIVCSGTGFYIPYTTFAAVTPTTTNGDMIVHAGGIATRLPVGAELSRMEVASGAPTWVATPQTVPQGGTGRSTLTTAYGILTAGTTATGAIQTLPSLGTNNQVLVSRGAGALPEWDDVSVNIVTLDVAQGGTGVTSLSPYRIIAGGTTSTADVQSVTAGTSGQYLISNGSSALPSWLTPPKAPVYITTLNSANSWTSSNFIDWNTYQGYKLYFTGRADPTTLTGDNISIGILLYAGGVAQTGFKYYSNITFSAPANGASLVRGSTAVSPAIGDSRQIFMMIGNGPGTGNTYSIEGGGEAYMTKSSAGVSITGTTGAADIDGSGFPMFGFSSFYGITSATTFLGTVSGMQIQGATAGTGAGTNTRNLTGSSTLEVQVWGIPK